MDFDDPSSSDEINSQESRTKTYRTDSFLLARDVQNTSIPVPASVPTSPPGVAQNSLSVRAINIIDECDDGMVDGGFNGGTNRCESWSLKADVSEEKLYDKLCAMEKDVERPITRHCITSKTASKERQKDDTDYARSYNDSTVKDLCRGQLEDDVEVVSIEDSNEWDGVLASMTLVDVTPMSFFYSGHGSFWNEQTSELEEPSYDTGTMVKTISPFYLGLATMPQIQAREGIRAMVLDTLQRLASHMRLMQQTLREAGLTADSQPKQEDGEDLGRNSAYLQKGEEKIDFRYVVCRGVHSVHVDSACRLVGVIETDACVVSLSDVIAFSARPFSQYELVAILKSVIGKVSKLHAAGIVHGCLHGGNVLCSTDNGSTVLTGVSGIMSNPFFPADPSFISPRLAAAIQPLVDAIWDDELKKTSVGTFSWAADPAFHRAVLERYGCTAETPMKAQFADDLYAIGILTLSCLLGVPPFHSATLKEVINVLAQYNSAGGAVFLLGDIFTSNYAIRRFKLADYSEEFVDLAKEFVVMCLDAGCRAHAVSPTTAEKLLLHPFFARHPLDPNHHANSDADEEGTAEDTDEIEEPTLIDRILHCLAYPIFGVMDYVRRSFGESLPFFRMYRNSIFVARWNNLQGSLLYGTNSDCGCSTDMLVSSLWPYLNKSHVFHWLSHGSNICCDEKQKDFAQGSLFMYRLLAKSSLSFFLPFLQDMGHDGVKTLARVAKVKGLKMDDVSHSLFFCGKSNERLVLHRDEMPIGYRSTVETLVLQGLENCVVEVLVSFRYVVIRDVRFCEIYLAPCYYIYCDDVTHCSPIAAASVHMYLGNVLSVDFCYSGFSQLLCGDANAKLENVLVRPYNITYAGLSEDFAAIPLPQESGLCMSLLKNPSVTITSAVRALNVHNTLRGGSDYPYSHALAAFGDSFTHENDDISDVFFFFSELVEKNVLITHIHGSRHYASEEVSKFLLQPSSSFLQWMRRYTKSLESKEETGNDGSGDFVSCPTIFILDVVGDCIIEDCSFCTVFVVGSLGTVSLRRCSEVRLFVMAKEVLFEECDRINEAHLFVTESLFMDCCRDVNLFPLAVEAPHIEQIVSAIVDSSSNQTIHRIFVDALRQKNISTLNALLRSETDAGAVELVDCDDVHLHPVGDRVFVVEFPFSEAPQSKFFREAYSKSRSAENLLFVPFMRYIWGKNKQKLPVCGAFLPPVRFHDIVNASILRLPGTLNVRGAFDETLPLVDVVLERVVFGVIHLVEALGTLFIRRCTGHLSIIVCSATSVIMESCEHLTLQIACGSFTAKDCHCCHVALHVNTRPRYEACTSMWTSTLNITSEDFESYLERSNVQLDVNLFDQPLVCPFRGKEIEGSNCDGVLSNTVLTDVGSIDSLEKALAVLHNPLTFVQPILGTCLGIKDASFIGPIEDRVILEEKTRKSFEGAINEALRFISCRYMESLAETDTTGENEECGSPDILHKANVAVDPVDMNVRHVDPLVDCFQNDMNKPDCTSECKSLISVSRGLSGEIACLHSGKPGSSEYGNIKEDTVVRSSDSCKTANDLCSSSYFDARNADPTSGGNNLTTLFKEEERCEKSAPADSPNMHESTQQTSRPSSLHSSHAEGANTALELDVASRSSVVGDGKRTAGAGHDDVNSPAVTGVSAREECGSGAKERDLNAHITTDSSGTAAGTLTSEKSPRRWQSFDFDKEKYERTASESAVCGELSFANCVVDVHPDDEEAVRAAFCEVQIVHERRLSLLQDGGSSLDVLKQRVSEAVRLLQEHAS